MPRERAAVREWEENEHYQFHVIRDHPQNMEWAINGGLWGANNYVDFSKAVYIKKNLFDTIPDGRKGTDQRHLRDRQGFKFIYFLIHSLEL